MKNKAVFFIFSLLILVGIFFCIQSCQDINSQKRTTININLDLSTLVKSSRNENSTGTTATPTEYLLKIFAYDATSYKDDVNIDNLTLTSQTESKVDINGNVRASLEVEIGLKVIFVAKLYEVGEEKPIYEGNSEIFIVKPTDNKVHIYLSKVQSDVDIQIGINPDGSINYKVEHYQQNIYDNKYTLVESDTETKAGKLGEKTQAVEKTYTGFTVREFDQQTIISDGSTLVKIYYDRISYTVTFNANGGNLTDNKTQSVKYEGKIAEPNNPTKSEYFFDGWYTSSGASTTLESRFDFSAPITSDITLYARWSEQEQIAYTVEHYQQNIENEEYTLKDTENKIRKTGEQIQASPNEYYGFSVKTMTQETLTEDGSTLVKIYYNRNLYTVTFNANGGNSSDISSQALRYQGKATLPTTSPTRDGYIFLGWYTLDEGVANLGDEAFNFDTQITSDIELYAKWWNSSSFVYVEGAVIDGAITAEGYTTSEIFKEGAIVSIPDFYICDHEVTQAEYKAIMGTWPDASVTTTDKPGVGDIYPAYYVSWFDALVYCNKRSFQENLTPCYIINESTDPYKWGDVPRSTTDENYSSWVNVTCDFQANGYRLPTSAEWEYAARGGNGLYDYQYQYSGSDNTNEVAWYYDSSESKIHEVKTKKSNSLKLYDISGNLAEWCWNCNINIDNRYLHGGDWGDFDTGITVSCKDSDYVYTRQYKYGFRVVRTTTEQSKGDVYSQGISLNGKIYDKTSEVVVVPSGTVARIAMTDDSSWSSYLEDDVDLWYKGVFLKDRKVQLSPFAMSRFEVTQELYEAVIGSHPSIYVNNQTTDELVKLRPVDSVKWYDAVNFCNELTRRTMGEEYCVYKISGVVMDETNSYISNANVTVDLSKKGYRLPTEAEWEFAARGGNPESDVWKYGFAGVSTDSSTKDDYFWSNTEVVTHEVGRKNANTLGLYDMSGNVHEWTCDGYKLEVTITDEFIENPVEIPLVDDMRYVARGGNFNSEIYAKYVSYRHATKSETGICGFRLVRTITE